MLENIHEEWRSIKGYEDFYEISNLGRLRSLDRVSCGRSHKGRMFSPSCNSGGYRRVTLTRDGKPKHFYVHELVAAAFVGPRPERHDVCHNDGNPSNNWVGNLRYDTRAGNFADKRLHGTLNVSKRRVLTPDAVRNIRQRLEDGVSGRSLARQYGVTPATITHVKTGLNWSHVV